MRNFALKKSRDIKCSWREMRGMSVEKNLKRWRKLQHVCMFMESRQDDDDDDGEVGSPLKITRMGSKAQVLKLALVVSSVSFSLEKGKKAEYMDGHR